MGDDGTSGDGVAGDGVFTARVTFDASPSARTLGYLVVPSGAEMSDAVGLAAADGSLPLPIPVEVPGGTGPFTLEVRYTPNPMDGFGPHPAVADSWNTGFSLDPSLRRENELLVVGTFQPLLGAVAWDATDRVTLLADDGAFGDRAAHDGIASFALVSPVGLGQPDAVKWRVSQRAQGAARVLSLGPSGWSDGAEGSGEGFSLSAPRWVPVRFEVDLLRGTARASGAPELLDLPLISQISPRAATKTYLDVMNTANATLALEGVYLADDPDYYRLSDPPSQISNGREINVTFPSGAWIAPGQTRTLTITGDMEDFAEEHGRPPDYVVVPEPTEPHHMRLAYPQSVRTTVRGLTDDGEYVVLYSWIAGMPLVEDLDIIVWGTPDRNRLPLKTDLVVGDASYGEDLGTVAEKMAQTVTIANPALWRRDFRRLGAQRFHSCSPPCAQGTSFNGVFHPGLGGRFDATDHDLSEESGRLTRGPAAPGKVAALSLSGVVQDESANPVAGVSVLARRGGDVHTTETSATGAFTLGVPHGSWKVSASAPGYAATTVQVRVDHQKSLLEPIVLAAATQIHTLDGVVLASTSGAPVSSALVEVVPGDASVRTSADGRFALPLLEGLYALTVTAGGFLPSVREVNLDRGTSVAVFLEPVGPTVVVSGEVRRGTDDTPLSGATVELDDGAGVVRTAGSDSAGRFTVSLLPPNVQYELTASAPGYEPHSQMLFVGAAGASDIAIALYQTEGALKLFGSVTRADSGDPISGASVELEMPGGVVRGVAAGQDGRYAFTGLPGGQYGVSASAAGFVTSQTPLNLTADAELDFSLRPRGTDDVRLIGTVGLVGLSPAQWAGSTVTATGVEQRSVLTRDGGTYEMPDLSPGSYTITAARDGFQTDVRVITVEEDATIDFMLERSLGEDAGCDCVTADGTSPLAPVLLLLWLVHLGRLRPAGRHRRRV